MVMPIYLAWAAMEPLPQPLTMGRLQVILDFLDRDARTRLTLQTLQGAHAGLAFIDYADNPFAIPLMRKSSGRLTTSAYLPFGAAGIVSDQALASGEYLPRLMDMLRHSPQVLRELTPPQVFCDLDLQRNKLTIRNDWRGFGRLYEYKTAFGSVWSNKMAAALIFAAVPARLDTAAMADMAACGMFSGSGTGYENMRLAAPSSLIEADIMTGDIHCHTLSDAPGGLVRAMPGPEAIEETHAALSAWMGELGAFHGQARLHFNLSGGRDSRVVGSALLTSGLQPEITVCAPPVKDGELAQRLLRLAGFNAPPETQARRQMIERWYAAQGSLTDVAADFLHNKNSDISVKLFFSWPSQVADTSGKTLFVCGDQGEVAHNCYYTPQMFAMELGWLKERRGQRPSGKRLRGIVDALSVKSFGVTPDCGCQVAANIRANVLDAAASLNLDSFYYLDFLYLYFFLNRQWPGATGAFDRKTPLTVYPYVQNGFNQPLEDKINSRFVRDVIASFMPAWTTVPFFHELPEDETHDFYVAYPTYWEMGRGEELIALCDMDSIAWQLFDRSHMRNTFAQMLDADSYASQAKPKISAINTAAQKLLWIMTIERQLADINTLAGAETTSEPEFTS